MKLMPLNGCGHFSVKSDSLDRWRVDTGFVEGLQRSRSVEVVCAERVHYDCFAVIIDAPPSPQRSFNKASHSSTHAVSRSKGARQLAAILGVLMVEPERRLRKWQFEALDGTRARRRLVSPMAAQYHVREVSIRTSTTCELAVGETQTRAQYPGRAGIELAI